MTPNYDQTFQDRSEYQGERGPQYRTPAGQPRALTWPNEHGSCAPQGSRIACRTALTPRSTASAWPDLTTAPMRWARE